jgi:hypothetical protein
VAYDLAESPPPSPNRNNSIDPQRQAMMSFSVPFSSQSPPAIEKISSENSATAISETDQLTASKTVFLPLFLVILGSMMVLFWR